MESTEAGINSKCREGIAVRRLKGGTLSPRHSICIRDGKLTGYHSSRLCPFLKTGAKSVDFSNLLEVRTGFSTDNLHRVANSTSLRKKILEQNCFSIIFKHPQFLQKCVDFVATNPDDAATFVKALRYCIEKYNKERINFDEQHWLLEQFQKADSNHDGKLSFDEIWKLLKKLNLDISEDYALNMFKSADNAGEGGDKVLDKNEFLNFFEKLTDRPEIDAVLKSFSSTNDAALTPEELKRFLIEEQNFEKFDDAQVQEVIKKFEPLKPEEEKKAILGPIGFRRLVLSTEWGSIIKLPHVNVFQDMNMPLNNYYVNSSHNTYLTGLQLTGEATVEGYIRALRKGVRLLELDIFNGDHGEPCITHKRTFITAITLKSALKAISDNAFTNSPFPVILTIENHVGLDQQPTMAKIFKEILGNRIYMRPKGAGQLPLPSPNALRGKFLLRGKKLPTHKEDKEFDDSADGVENQKKGEKITLDPVYSELISLPSVKLSHDIYRDVNDHPKDGSPSVSESKVIEYYQSGGRLATYTAERFVKAYPKGIRQDSSNMDPMPSWLSGVQSVAMNIQTCGEYMDLVNGLFRINGNCGYVLKPECLRNGLDPRLPEVSKNPVMKLSVDIISGQYLPNPSADSDVIDPYVSVEIFGIPSDCKKVKTKVIMNNGFNPQWNEAFVLYLRCPQVALLRFCVKDFDSTSSNDFVGEYTLPVLSIRPGYSHIHLNTGCERAVEDSASIFVRVTCTKI